MTFYLLLAASIVASASAYYDSVIEKGKPHQCVQVLLYDMFGEGWGVDTQLLVNNYSFNLLSDWESGIEVNFTNATQCTSRFHRVCNEEGDFDIRVATNNTRYEWEVFFGVQYLKKSYFGSVDSKVAIHNGKVEFDNIFDATDREENKCQPCEHQGGADSYPISLRDARGKRWFQKAGPKEVVEIDGFSVPAVLVYPRYFIATASSSSNRRLTSGNPLPQLIAEGTMCSPSGNEVCLESLSDGAYTFRVGGKAENDETWTFCNSSGVVGEELFFEIFNGTCSPIEKRDSELICKVAPLVPASVNVALESEVILHGSNGLLVAVEAVCAASFFVVAMMFILSRQKNASVEFEELPQDSEAFAVKKDGNASFLLSKYSKF